ncbi:NAD(P)H-dependent glycerol-3-phosphate dehydrogenase [Salinarimonas ramus]|uniref:Glycerol-3-phosphate dehydrogenase [NAD(P)+] n=1 Tax=Salinarimonas ramus TaxID=690164 RepID=A0A917V4E3_9HYPH|nr:NAD(P)H-dependent glycerol-3-phosphate dehydrogenase [Salinarimonas ramus]GGK35704.1 glycerol-3-phosphate dehydrogenase [NAD(P)+] [Salinarimonas ramus]
MTLEHAAARSLDEQRPAVFDTIAVIGAGSWGTALALTAWRAGRRVRLWAREEHVVDAVARERRNPFLPHADIPEELLVTNEMEEALAGADLVVLVSPSQHLRAVAGRVEPLIPRSVPVVVCAKGIERETGYLMGEVIEEVMPGREMAVLSGPTFAGEVAQDMATGVTVAAAQDDTRDGFHDDHLAARVAVTFASESFRPYVSDDVRGVEIGGAAKNVIAIACGVAEGLGLGSNARAMIITRGLAEITELGLAIGARLETLLGLAGAGDLMLTCSSTQSRNFSYGKALGAGEEAVRRADGPVVEGAENAQSVVALARRLGVKMPVCETVLGILDGAPVSASMKELMLADLHPEAVGASDDWTTPHPARIELEEERLSA